MSHGQNLRSTFGEPEFVAQYFFEIPASGGECGILRITYVILTVNHEK
jgi:hypothetical protein